MAAQVNAQIEVNAPTAFSFEAIGVDQLQERWLKHHEHVLRSSVHTIRRYRTATQHLINVYRSEVLHLLSMHPERKGNTLSRSEFGEMWTLIVDLLKIGKRYNRIIIADPEDVGKPRSRMNRSERLLVYKKEFCTRCETPIESWKLAARKVFTCPVCQRRR